MPSKKQSNKRAQGGGRSPNSEPKLQVFRDFGGVNFELANGFNGGVAVDRARSDSIDQTDLQMNFMFLQNNVMTTSNKTMETRDDIITMFNAPDDVSFTGPVCLIGSKLYIATNNEKNSGIGIGNVDQSFANPVTINDYIQSIQSHDSKHEWTSFDYYDNQLIALTKQNEIYTGPVSSSFMVDSIGNAKEVPNPTYNPIVNLIAKGSLKVSEESGGTDECPFRISLACTYINKFGPTKLSPIRTFYANHPVSEWHAGCYLQIEGGLEWSVSSFSIKAVEIYYSTDNAAEMLFLGRIDLSPTHTGWWHYDWFGYIDATSMWPMANLIAPTENYTKGVHASRVCDIDGRMYFWGDSNNPQRLYIGGNPGNLLSISPGVGGGFVDVEPGTSQEIKYVDKYKTQSGNSIVTMLCDSPNSHKEQRFNLVENSISLSNEQNMKSWQAEQVAGAVGCKSYYGAIVCADGLYSVSRYGLALTTMTMEYNAQIRTNYISDVIKPVFTDAADMNTRLKNAMLIEVDGIIYMALGASSDQQGNLDNVVFCYDINLKAWWTYTLDVDNPILNLFHVDWQGRREGIGIVTSKHVYMLPTTISDKETVVPKHSFLIETAQLSTQMPQQGWQYLSQMEFHFDHFVGSMKIELRMTDMFGRKIKVIKNINETSEQFDYVVHMRVDQRVMSYVITMTGTARFRMTHFIARVYTLSNKISQVWGFDDSISHRSSGSVHPTFKCYNDLRKAIFT